MTVADYKESLLFPFYFKKRGNHNLIGSSKYIKKMTNDKVEHGC